jgi:hypothetical protein
MTHAIKDRVVQTFQLNGPELLTGFVDGSTMTVTIEECPSPSGASGPRSAIIRRNSIFNEGKDTDTWGIADRLAGSVPVVEVGDHLIFTRSESGEISSKHVPEWLPLNRMSSGPVAES